LAPSQTSRLEQLNKDKHTRDFFLANLTLAVEDGFSTNQTPTLASVITQPTIPKLQEAESKGLQIITCTLVLAVQAPGGCVVRRASKLLVHTHSLLGGGWFREA